MAVRRGISTTQWQDAQVHFCMEGWEFAQQHATAGAAWRACQKGSFMAYWLVAILNRVPKSAMLACKPGRGFIAFRPSGGTPAKRDTNDRLYAEAIRARYCVDGRLRKGVR